MTEQTQDDPMAAVREGMTVRDAAGADIGTVELVKLSDPGVVTGEGQDPDAAAGGSLAPSGPTAVPMVPVASVGTGGVGAGAMGTPYAAAPFGLLAAGIAGAAEPDVPEEFRDRLLRTGYLKIDSKGLFRRDVYVAADQLAGVDEDTVTLSTTKDSLIRED
jgi:hypothetical protein